MASKSQPIIVIKKKAAHSGPHGGAWKVAYADFVTAMMSLFIVLWLMGQSESVKRAVAGYFNDPKGTANLLGTTMTGNGVTMIEHDEKLKKLKEKLEAEIKAKKELEKLSKQIEITITPEGLRIELLEEQNGTFYKVGSAQLSANGQELLALLASELKTLPNSLLIEGHTDAMQYSTDASYGNWELSADRANAARRLLQQDGVRSDQVTQVRGYADQLLRVKNNPYDPSNRRISILVKNSVEGASPQIPGHTQIVGDPSGAKLPPAKTNPGPTERQEVRAGVPPASTKPQFPPPLPTSSTAASAKPGLASRLSGFVPGFRGK